MDMNEGLCPRLVDDIPDPVHRIHRGMGVRHGQDRRHAAVSGRLRAGADIFLIGLARIPQMHMKIHQPRRDCQP